MNVTGTDTQRAASRDRATGGREALAPSTLHFDAKFGGRDSGNRFTPTI
jgi:hypothetical protein